MEQSTESSANLLVSLFTSPKAFFRERNLEDTFLLETLRNVYPLELLTATASKMEGNRAFQLKAQLIEAVVENRPIAALQLAGSRDWCPKDKEVVSAVLEKATEAIVGDGYLESRPKRTRHTYPKHVIALLNEIFEKYGPIVPSEIVEHAVKYTEIERKKILSYFRNKRNRKQAAKTLPTLTE